MRLKSICRNGSCSNKANQTIRIENFTSVLIFGHLAKSAHVRDVNFPSIWRLNVNSHSDRIGSAVDSVLFTPTQNVIRQHTWRSKFPQKKLWPQAAMYGKVVWVIGPSICS